VCRHRCNRSLWGSSAPMIRGARATRQVDFERLAVISSPRNH